MGNTSVVAALLNYCCHLFLWWYHKAFWTNDLPWVFYYSDIVSIGHGFLASVTGLCAHSSVVGIFSFVLLYFCWFNSTVIYVVHYVLIQVL